MTFQMCVWLVLYALSMRLACAWDQQPDGYEVIDGPSSTDEVNKWRNEWQMWRKMELLSVRYDPNDVCTIYNQPQTQWTQSNYLQHFLMLQDRAIYDRDTQSYTVDTYLDEMEKRFGRIDSVLLWSGYPNIGIDNRNQWDLIRDAPGGLEGVRGLIHRFHERDVRVFLPYNPWDTATRDEEGKEEVVRMYLADIKTLRLFSKSLGADGFNGDTMYGVPKVFYNCSDPLVAAPEGGVPSAYLSHNPMSWGYFLGYSNFPPVSRAKFLEPRHMVQVCARWSLDKMKELQAAFFNGVGYVVWENVWGIWNAMTPRESEAAKRIFHVLRHFTALTTSATWTPYAVSSFKTQTHASEFASEDGKQALFAIVSSSSSGTDFQLPLSRAQENMNDIRFFDVFTGRELRVQNSATADDSPFVQITVPPSGFGGVLRIASELVDDKLRDFLKEMREMTMRPLEEFSNERYLLKQHMVKPTTSKPASLTTATADSKEDDKMVHIKGSKHWWFNVSGVQIEPVPAWTPNAAVFGTGVQFPWESRPSNSHSVGLEIGDFLLDRFPVTNAQYQKFLLASGYEPQDRTNFLRHWTRRQPTDSLTAWEIPTGLENAPVVHVAWEDASAYAAFYNKRLPHDWEWQYVASNGDQYTKYPWGNDFDASRMPTPQYGRVSVSSDPVGSHPSSRSVSYDVHDLVGFVWQMTDSFCDTHTCGLLLRGGSPYRPVASSLGDPNWYFPQALETQSHNRFLMLSESYERSAQVGFRCVRDISPSPQWE